MAERDHPTPAAVGERIWIEGVRTARAGDDLTGPPDIVSAVAVVHHVTTMLCGCQRITCPRPLSDGVRFPYIAVHAPGCSWIGCGEDVIDLDVARATAAEHNARAGADR